VDNSQQLQIRGLLANRSAAGSIVVDLGCGQKKQPGAIGIDRLGYEGVDLVGEAREVLQSFPGDSVDKLVSRHFLEHVADLEGILEEMLRITKPGGTIEVVVPHFSNPYFYSDYTHRQPFGLYTFCYLAKYERALLRRAVPNYRTFPGLRLVSVDLVFKASRPFYVRHALDRLIGLLFNSCRMMKELYERGFCYAWPCYELRYVLAKDAVAPS
jgi:SAM-dependent methyltransferase